MRKTIHWITYLVGVGWGGGGVEKKPICMSIWVPDPIFEGSESFSVPTIVRLFFHILTSFWFEIYYMLCSSWNNCRYNPVDSLIQNAVFIQHFSKISLLYSVQATHRWINYKDPRTKCRHLKKLTWKGTLRQMFIRVWKTGNKVSLVGIFDPALWTIAPLTFSLVTYPRFPSSLCLCTVQYIQTVCGWDGVGGVVESCWWPYSWI